MLYNPRYRRYGAYASAAGIAGSYYRNRNVPGTYANRVNQFSSQITGAGKRSVWRKKSSVANKGGGKITATSTRGTRVKAVPKRNYKNNKLNKDMRVIKNAIKDLRHSENASLGTMVYRNLHTVAQLSLENVRGIYSYDINTPTILEAIGASLKYYDPSTPGTLITAPIATGTYAKNFLFKKVSGTMTARNNYQSDCRIRVYLCRPRDDTDLTPNESWQAGVDKESNLTSLAAKNQYPNDYDFFKDLWNAKLILNTTLSPGEQAKCSHSENDIEYDPSNYDSHNLNYQREFKSYVFLAVVEGCLAHDSASSALVGYAAAGIDLSIQTTAEIHYDAGVNIKYYVQGETVDVFTGVAVQSHQPVADNQPYSVA